MKINYFSIKIISIKFLIFFLFLLTNSMLISQTSDATLRKIGFLTGNNIGLTAYNDGAISGFRQGVDIRGEWPLGSGEFYIGDITPCFGLELDITNSDGLSETIHSVIISRGPRMRQGSERHPTELYFWGFNPVNGSINPNSNSFAISTDISTWPDSWNNVWKGLYNTNQIIANQEAYFVMDDFWDDEFNEYFHPDETDLSITGHGIEISVRYLQFNSNGLEDVFFRVYDIKNNSQHNYNKVFFGNVTGTLMGGDGDSSDDLAMLDSTTQIIYSFDSDGLGNTGQRTATMGEAFIESPSSNDIGNFRFFSISASPPMDNDSLLWSRFTKPNPYNSSPPVPMDGDMLYSTKLFSLNSQETIRIVSVIAFDYSKGEVEEKILLAKTMWNNQFDIVGVKKCKSAVSEYSLLQNYPNPFNPSTVINFSIPESDLVTLKIFNILGQEVAELVNDVKSAGSYEVSFDASNLTTGMYFYKIQAGNYTATKKMLLIK